MRVVVLVLAVLALSFFAVFAFHVQSPVQQQVKLSLEAGGQDFPFSAQANSHMRDVYGVLVGARVFAALLFAALLWLLPSMTGLHLRVSGGVLVALPVLLALVPWGASFTALHLVFFPQGNWTFPADSAIIQTYPQEFFVSFAIAWGVLVAIIGACFLLFAGRWESFRTALS